MAAAVLYLVFGDLSRHKGRIESLVTSLLGRRFAIEGAFKLQVLPSIVIAAEHVQLANMEQGTQPQMVEIGRLSAKIGLWSLLRGPVDVRSLEAADVSVFLEKGADGKDNWAFGQASASEAVELPGSNAVAVPVVLQHGKLDNVRITYRERGRPDFVALVQTLSVDPGRDGLLAIAGKGKLNDLAAAIAGELGPMEALLSARNLRFAIQASLGELRLEASGTLGRLDPLAGADLAVKAMHPDMGALLKKLGLPVVASGALTAEARLTDAGDLTRLELAAGLGDIKAKAGGTLRTLGLPGSDLHFEVVAADARRLAAVFGVTGVQPGVLELGGRVVSSRTEIRLDGISARFAGAKARIDGTVRGERAELRFALAAAKLARLREGLPDIALSINGIYAGDREEIEVKSLKGRIGESEISGRASMRRTGKRRVEVELASPRLDLTPLAGEENAERGSRPKPVAKAPQRKFVFADTPLPLGELKDTDARLRFSATEVALGTGVLRDVETTILVEGGRLTLEGRARGSREGAISATVRLVPSGGAAALDLTVTAKNVRTGLGVSEAIDPAEEPPTSIEATLVAKGASARQMASGANGKVLVTQGPGKLKNGLAGMIGGDLIGELAGKLNPFAAQDPYTQLECTVARVDLVDGRAGIQPVLVQTQKVTIVASGSIDLGTEALTLGFDTRPRTGIGVSAGMFTNPFIELAGTLASPRLGVGAKGATAGAAAVATGGATVIAQGLADRVRGAEDLCKKTLKEAAAGAN